MLTSAEKHFIQSWKEQREGPRWKYYLQYIIAWSTVSFISLFFLTKLLMSDRSMGGWISFYIVLAASIILAAFITHLVYKLNQKKFTQIIQREEPLNKL
jgi:uncharacterized membrane protein (DUF485 family)